MPDYRWRREYNTTTTASNDSAGVDDKMVIPKPSESSFGAAAKLTIVRTLITAYTDSPDDPWILRGVVHDTDLTPTATEPSEEDKNTKWLAFIASATPQRYDFRHRTNVLGGQTYSLVVYKKTGSTSYTLHYYSQLLYFVND